MSQRNENLRRYLTLSEQVKAMEEERREIRDRLVKIGTHTTADFECRVEQQDRRTLPSLATLERDHEDILALLLKRGLIGHSEVQIVRVERRRAIAASPRKPKVKKAAA